MRNMGGDRIRLVSRVLVVLCYLVFSVTAQNLSDKNIPQAVLDTIERELPNATIKEIGKDTDDGKTAH